MIAEPHTRLFSAVIAALPFTSAQENPRGPAEILRDISTDKHGGTAFHNQTRRPNKPLHGLSKVTRMRRFFSKIRVHLCSSAVELNQYSKREGPTEDCPLDHATGTACSSSLARQALAACRRSLRSCGLSPRGSNR